MADISKITLPNGKSYNFKDSRVRTELESKAEKALYGDTTINVGRLSGSTVGDYSTAEGTRTTASGNCSHTEGSGTVASGNCSHAEGSVAQANGDGSHAEGLDTHANASYSHAEGSGTVASGNCSHAEGSGAQANAPYSHAEGYNTRANAPYSHAEGNGTQANGDNSHAEGFITQANGNNSHAGGCGANSFNNGSFSHGIYTIANKDAEIALGKYNKSSSDTLFSVGDGTTDNARHNAIEITKMGGMLHDKDIVTIDDISNPNLLINPDFRVNQRGASGTIYGEIVDGVYAIKYIADRWVIHEGNVTINGDGTLTLDGIIVQYLENAVGSNVVASASAGTAAYDETLNAVIITGNGDIISWAKLEYGDKATPFILPNITEEQIKCQRYYLGLNAYIRYPMTRLTSSTIDFIIPVNAMMRRKPTIEGTPIVYNNANANAQSDFSFSIIGIGINAIVVRATKSNHGITSAYLDMSNGVSFDAEV